MVTPYLRSTGLGRLSAAINRLCTDTVQVAVWTRGSDGYPDGTFAAPVAYPAYVVYKVDEIRDMQGNLTTAMGRLMFASPGPPALSPDDRITLPDGTTPRILAVQPADAINPVITVYFG